jgi:HEAT repeat protein
MNRASTILLMLSALGASSSAAGAEFKRVRFDFKVPLGQEAPGMAVDGHRVAFASGETVRVVDARTGELIFERSAMPKGVVAASSPWVQVLGLVGDAVYARVFLYDDPDRPDPGGGWAMVGGGPEDGRLCIVRLSADEPARVVLELPHTAMTADRLLDSALVYTNGAHLYLHPLEGDEPSTSFNLRDELPERPRVRGNMVLGVGLSALHIYSDENKKLERINYLGTPLASQSENCEFRLAHGYVLAHTGRRLLCYETSGELRFSRKSYYAIPTGDREIVCMLVANTVVGMDARDGSLLWKQRLPLYAFSDSDVNAFEIVDSKLLIFAEDKLVVLDAATGRVLLDMPQVRKLQRDHHDIYAVLCRMRTVSGAVVVAFETSVVAINLTPTEDVPPADQPKDPANATAALESLMTSKPDRWQYSRALVNIGSNLADTPRAFDAALPTFIARIKSDDPPPSPKLLMAFHWVRDPAVPAAMVKALPRARGTSGYLMAALAGHPDGELVNEILLRLVRDTEALPPHIGHSAAYYLRMSDAVSLSEADRALLYAEDPETTVSEFRRRLENPNATIRREALALLGRASDSVIVRLSELMRSLGNPDERQAADALLRDAAKRIALMNHYDEIEPPPDWQAAKLRAAEAAAKAATKQRAPKYSSPAEKTLALVKDLGSTDRNVWPKARKELQEMGVLAVPFLIEALESGKPEIRRHAAQLLGSIGRDARAAVPALIKALSDPDARLRVAAVYTLGRAAGEHGLAQLRRRSGLPPRDGDEGDATAVPALVAALRDSDQFMRGYAADALASIGPVAKDAVPALLAALNDPRDEEHLHARYKAALALAQIGPDAKVALPALVKALGDEERSVRYAAASVLCGMRADAAEAAPALIKLLGSDYSMFGDSRSGMRASIMDIGTGVIPALIEALGDDSVKVRDFAATILGQFGPVASDAVPALEDLGSASALGRIGVAAIPALTRLLGHADAKTRMLAAVALLRFGPDASPAIPSLAKALADKNAGVRRHASRALGSIGVAAKKSARAVAAVLSDEDPQARVYAAEALWRITGEAREQVEILIRLLDEEGWIVPSGAARSLGEIGPDAVEAVPALAKLLTHRNHLVRGPVAEALGRIGPGARAALPALEEALEDKGYKWGRHFVSTHAAVALWRITGELKRALPFLKAVVGSKWSSSPGIEALGEMGPAAAEAAAVLAVVLHKGAGTGIRQRAAEALGRIGPAAKDAVPALEKALGSYARNIRVAAAEALWRITGKTGRAVPVLVRIAQEKRWDQYLRSTRLRAVEVLGNMSGAASDAAHVLTELTEDEDPDIRQAAVDALRKIRTEDQQE